jgi:hypothetical protein
VAADDGWSARNMFSVFPRGRSALGVYKGDT